jgi:hypothetical protein
MILIVTFLNISKRWKNSLWALTHGIKKIPKTLTATKLKQKDLIARINPIDIEIRSFL